ncbi:MAG: Uma2 family endonuclease [Opitutaceae bacterium]|nr:Uma2 family endonuclease [Cytophagales bacterium]
MITSLDQLDLDKTYTYADYLKWQIDEYVELIRGKIVRMSPAPNTSHQTISLNIAGEFYSYLKSKSCNAFIAPFDVRLKRTENDEETITVVQPDICIICDPSKLDEKGCHGAPELIIEILSPSTRKKDIKDKFELYQEAGVLEYWIVSAIEQIIDVFILKDGKYVLLQKYVSDELVPVSIFPGFSIDLKDIFK